MRDPAGSVEAMTPPCGACRQSHCGGSTAFGFSQLSSAKLHTQPDIRPIAVYEDRVHPSEVRLKRELWTNRCHSLTLAFQSARVCWAPPKPEIVPGEGCEFRVGKGHPKKMLRIFYDSSTRRHAMVRTACARRARPPSVNRLLKSVSRAPLRTYD